jgi:hypothetical protein
MQTIVALALGAFIMTAGTAAAQDRAVPEFTVHDASGGYVASAVLAAQPKSLVVYLGPDCRSCASFMRALPKWQSPGLQTRLILLVMAKPADAAKWIEQTLPEEMRAITWYADPDRSAAKALKLTSAPVLLGVREGKIEWQLAGVLNDPAALESVVRSWVEDKQ